jgi:hypothetical protein
MKPDLCYLAALHSFQALDAEVMRSAVDSLMNEGFYVDECLAALDSEPAQLDEVLPAFHAALAHHGVVVPDAELAVWQIIDHHTMRIASRQDDPWKALQHLIEDLNGIYYDFQSIAVRYFGDSHGIERLVGIHWSLDEQAQLAGVTRADFKPNEQAIRGICEAAEEWSKKHEGHPSLRQVDEPHTSS